MKKQDLRSLIKLLRPKGAYSKTDVAGYVELSPSKIRAALLTKQQNYLFPAFSLIMDKDSAVGAEIEKRLSSVENKFFTHDLGEDQNENIEQIIKAGLQARLFGLGILEVYADEDANIKFDVVDRIYINIMENKPYLRIGSRDIEAKEPFFIVVRQEDPALLKILWLVFAKHFVLSHYLKFVEFLGVPPLIGNSSSGDENVITQMAEALEGIKSGSYAVLGPSDIVKVLEGRGSQADFMEFVRYCDAEIAKVINGSVLSSNANTAQSGSYAMSKTHEQNRAEIVAADVKFVTRLVERIYARLGKKANLNIQIEKDVDLLQRAQMLQILHELGYEMSPQDMAKEFDLPPSAKATPKNADDKPAAQTDAEKNSANAAKQAKYLTEIERQTAQHDFSAASSQISSYVRSVVDKAQTYEQAYEILAKNPLGFKLDALEDELFRIIANAEILGADDDEY